MNNPHLEELAALQVLDLLDEVGQRELFHAAERDPEIRRVVRDFTETAAALAAEVPEIKPPPDLKRQIIRQLPIPGTTSRIISFSSWIPYAIAACLMVIGIGQTQQIVALKSQLQAANAEVTQLAQSNALIGLRLATLEAKDTSYFSAKVIVAWDPHLHRGVVAMQNLPSPPPGRVYQLWVLDPGAEAPINAGLITPETSSQRFAVPPLGTAGPGFAISLEPDGGRPAPTGPILFALAPGE